MCETLFKMLEKLCFGAKTVTFFKGSPVCNLLLRALELLKTLKNFKCKLVLPCHTRCYSIFLQVKWELKCYDIEIREGRGKEERSNLEQQKFYLHFWKTVGCKILFWNTFLKGCSLLAACVNTAYFSQN